MNTSAALSPLTRLMDRIGHPGTGKTVEIIPYVKAGGDIKEGVIISDGSQIGTIENFKPRFTNVFGATPRQAITLERESVWDIQESSSLAPHLTVVDTYWRSVTDSLAIGHTGPIKLKFGAHPSSGIVAINGIETDLFHANSLVPLEIECFGPVEIVATGRRNPASKGQQILIESAALKTDEFRPAGYERVARNRARPFRSRALTILGEIPADGFMLDIGGGRRMMNDPRYFNMEYDVFDEADLYGDAQALPFLDNSIDFIHSTAVFEHLPRPHEAAAEIYRVLKPGGIAYVVTAFMQPVHSEPQHFYNASAFGMAEWFKMFKNQQVSWGGQMSSTLLTLARAGAKGAPDEKFDTLKRALEDLDNYVNRSSLMFIASEVTIQAVKD